MDKSVFWISLYANVIAWLVLFIWEMIRLKFIWAIIAFICLVFAGTNFYGYFKCSKTQQDNIMKFGAKAVLKVASKGVDSDKK